MQLQHSTTTFRNRPTGRRTLLAAALGAALLTAAAAGLWQNAAHRDTATSPIAELTSAPVAPVFRPAASIGSSIANTFTVYLVDSAEEAARVTDTINHGNSILGQFGRPAFKAGVFVVGTAEEAVEIAWANAEADNIRAGMGLPPITVIDLRPR